METTRTSAITYFSLRMAIITAIGIFTICSAFSQKNEVKPGAGQASVTYLKAEGGQVFFTLKYDNISGEKFDVAVNDAEGYKLYQGSFSGKDFSRVFRAPLDHGKLTVAILNVKNRVDHKFELSTESRFVDEVYVKKN